MKIDTPSVDNLREALTRILTMSQEIILRPYTSWSRDSYRITDYFSTLRWIRDEATRALSDTPPNAAQPDSDAQPGFYNCTFSNAAQPIGISTPSTHAENVSINQANIDISAQPTNTHQDDDLTAAYLHGFHAGKRAAGNLADAQSDDQVFGYVLKTGHGIGFSETLDNVHPMVRHLWTPVYRSLAAANAAQPTEQDDGGLLPLPKHFDLFNINGPDGHLIKGYTAEQMRAHYSQGYQFGHADGYASCQRRAAAANAAHQEGGA